MQHIDVSEQTVDDVKYVQVQCSVDGQAQTSSKKNSKKNHGANPIFYFRKCFKQQNLNKKPLEKQIFKKKKKVLKENLKKKIFQTKKKRYLFLLFCFFD